MPTLLHIDSSPMGDHSISRHLTSEYVARWKEKHTDGKVIVRDVTTSNIPALNAEWIGANFTPAEARTERQKEVISLSETLVDELFAADHYVIGVPMHNFSIPSNLKLWIDQICRAGRTFRYGASGPEGLLIGKKATFLAASGGVYDAGTQMASLNFVEPYLRTIFGFVGVTDTKFVNAGGAAQIMQGKVDVPTFLQPHFETIRSHF